MQTNLLFSLVIGLSSLTSYGAELIVSNTNDTGTGSLRDQISLANATDTISFDPALNGSTITLTSGYIAFAKSLTILGPGYDHLTISGNSNSRIFSISDGDVVINGLKLIDGSQTEASLNDGGAIYHTNAGTLNLRNLHIDNSIAINSNGSQGGAVFYAVNNGTFQADSCMFTNCSADNYGGALSLNGGPDNVIINYCLFDGNNSSFTGVFFTNTSDLLVSNSTFSNNTATSNALFDLGSNDETDTFTFENCTFSNNNGSTPSGSFYFSVGTLSFINCTHKDNNESIYIEEDNHDDGTLILQNSVFDNSVDNFIIVDFPILVSNGGNISNDASASSFLTESNDLNSTNPMLGSLANLNGFMTAYPVLNGSPCINNGTNSGAPITDQIGVNRDALPDAGSIEFICVADITTSLSGTTISANSSTATYVWLDCDDNYSVISGETSQSFEASANGNYAVELTENGCTDTSDCVAITSVGIDDELAFELMEVYPNPTSGKVFIRFNKMQSELRMNLFNIAGDLIATKTTSESDFIELDISEAKGIYFIELINDQGQKKTIRVAKR